MLGFIKRARGKQQRWIWSGSHHRAQHFASRAIKDGRAIRFNQPLNFIRRLFSHDMEKADNFNGKMVGGIYVWPWAISYF